MEGGGGCVMVEGGVGAVFLPDSSPTRFPHLVAAAAAAAASTCGTFRARFLHVQAFLELHAEEPQRLLHHPQLLA